jgi:hypothetical protein
MNNKSDTNSKILQIADRMRKKGKPIPAGVHEIPDFPYPSFESLREALRHGKVLLQRFSVNYDSGIFNLFATPIQRSLNTLYFTLGALLPLTSVILAFVYSWWWLAGAVSLFVALGRSKKLYNRVILSAAMSSELFFSFLYFTGQVCVTTSDFTKSYYWHKAR